MQKIIIRLFFIFTNASVVLNAQVNLVVNPSFESYTACPSATGVEINKITDWDTCRGSADYFNECGTTSLIQVPKNYFGHQHPAHGKAYCGFYTYISSGFYRELIVGKLNAPMVTSQKYFISLKVNRADSNFIVGYSTNKIGVKFSKVKQGNVAINNSAHFYNSAVITDTINWTKISGSFVADSTYGWIMIGNFFDDANTTTFNHGNGTSAYYYIDEICVGTDSAFVENYSTSLKTNLKENEINIFPNPADKLININYFSPNEVKVYNGLGEELFKLKIQNTQINCSDWPSGFYFIEIKRVRYKIIINH